MANTATLGGARPKVIRPSREKGTLAIAAVNSGGEALTEGQEVYVKSDGTVAKRTLGTQYPIGIVSVGGANGEDVTIESAIQSKVISVASGGTLTPGGFVKPTGTVDVSGRPAYAAAVAGDYISAIVLVGATVGNEVTVGILRTPFQLNA